MCLLLLWWTCFGISSPQIFSMCWCETASTPTSYPSLIFHPNIHGPLGFGDNDWCSVPMLLCAPQAVSWPFTEHVLFWDPKSPLSAAIMSIFTFLCFLSLLSLHCKSSYVLCYPFLFPLFFFSFTNYLLEG